MGVWPDEETAGPGLRSLARDISARSSSASASPWIHAASSRKAVDKKEKVCMARRSRCVESAIRAYTRRRPRAFGSGMRKIYAVV